MPIYEYRCLNGHRFEVFQSMTEDPVEVCEECAAPVERVFHPVAVHFKGSGFYTTDYARKGAAGSDGKPSEAKEGKKGEAKGDSATGNGSGTAKKDKAGSGGASSQNGS